MYRPSFFFNDTATTEIYTLSLHDALPIYGACKIDKLAARAAEFGQPALGLTDHGVMNGAVELYKACRKHDVRPVFGFEAYFADDRHARPSASSGRPALERNHLTLLAETDAGFRNLVKL